jgi:hypothetical protein
VNLAVLVVFAVIAVGAYEVYLRVNNALNFDSKTAVGLPIFTDSEEMGWEHEPNSLIEDYNGENLVINAFGHRDTVKLDAEKSILMLGDSFTFGINAKQSEIFPVLIDEELKGYDLYNEGTIGFTTDNHSAYLNKYVLGDDKVIEPDLVVLNFFVGNDVTELRRHNVLLDDNGIPAMLEDDEVFVGDDKTLQSLSTPEPVSHALYNLSNKWEAFRRQMGWYVNENPTLTWPVFLSAEHPSQDPSLEIYWSETEGYLKGIQEALDQRGIEFFVAIIPMDVQVSKVYWDKYPGMPFGQEAFDSKRPQNRLADFFTEEGIDFVDLLPIFQFDKRKEQIYFAKDDTHFTSYGHQVTANAILQKINSYLE